MIINPYREPLQTYPDSNLLVDDFGLTNVEIDDTVDTSRVWTIQGVYRPHPGRVLGGLCIRLTDPDGFVSFINQRDLEVLLGLVEVGAQCRWSGRPYPGPGSDDWYGVCCDEYDLQDDLYARELELRFEFKDQQFCMPQGMECERRVHLERGKDVFERFWLMGDVGPDGISPDMHRSRVAMRWVRIERTSLEKVGGRWL